MARNKKNQCGIASFVTYPLLEGIVYYRESVSSDFNFGTSLKCRGPQDHTGAFRDHVGSHKTIYDHAGSCRCVQSTIILD